MARMRHGVREDGILDLGSRAARPNPAWTGSTVQQALATVGAATGPLDMLTGNPYIENSQYGSK